MIFYVIGEHETDVRDSPCFYDDLEEAKGDLEDEKETISETLSLYKVEVTEIAKGI